MQKIKTFFSIAMIVLGLVALPLATVAQAKVDIGDAKSQTKSGQCSQQGGAVNDGKCMKDGKEINSGLTGIFSTVVNILLFLVGAVAVIMLVIGGFRYVTSNGDQNAVSGAKNTILYAIIGIVVAFMAYAAVNFIVSNLT